MSIWDILATLMEPGVWVYDDKTGEFVVRSSNHG